MYAPGGAILRPIVHTSLLTCYQTENTPCGKVPWYLLRGYGCIVLLGLVFNISTKCPPDCFVLPLTASSTKSHIPKSYSLYLINGKKIRRLHKYANTVDKQSNWRLNPNFRWRPGISRGGQPRKKALALQDIGLVSTSNERLPGPVKVLVIHDLLHTIRSTRPDELRKYANLAKYLGDHHRRQGRERIYSIFSGSVLYCVGTPELSQNPAIIVAIASRAWYLLVLKMQLVYVCPLLPPYLLLCNARHRSSSI